ncbi:helix-turn-helix transcriptional regulator [Streptomyces sp. NPDC002054]|uniref:helix-turn-helix domain-containing protein n=1 Tax=Streptomyces sp. NPDC002054 TaxID=3154663 RepID=UPI00331A5A87
MDLAREFEEDGDPREEFQQELRTARELYRPRPLTQEALARKLKTSKSSVSRLERGEGPIPPEMPSLLDRIFETDGKFQRIFERIISGSFPVIYRKRMEEERKARVIWEWSPTIIPGLFQTYEYAYTLIRAGKPRASEKEVVRLARARVARQDVFTGPTPPDVLMILCESAVKREAAAPAVMHAQLVALLDHTQRPTTTVRVLPLNAQPNLLMDAPASILTSATHEQVVCVDQYRTTAVIAEPDHVRDAVAAFTDLVGEALSVRDSADLIREQMRSLT